MIFQPAIIALLLASLVCVGLLLAAAPLAIDLVRHWDIRSGSERQILLERRTYLLSNPALLPLRHPARRATVVVFNADRMSSCSSARVCAVGALRSMPSASRH